MAININHVYSADVTVIFYTEDGISLRYNDVGTMDDIIEQTSCILVKHDFCSADICNVKDGEVLVTVERS